MSAADGRSDDESAGGPVRVADFDGLDDPDEAGSAVRVASFDLDDDADPDDAGSLPDAQDAERARVVSFDDVSDTAPDDAGSGGTVRQVDFGGPRSADRQRSRGRSGRWDDAGGGRSDGERRSRRGASDGAGPDEGSARDRRGSRGGRGANRADAGPPPDDETRAKEICLRLLTDRARTVKELRDALVRKEIPDGVADRVLERFDEVGLVDDEAFAGQWVRSRHRHRGLGRRAIAQELRRKGVAKDIADEALTEIDAESEEARARELVDKKIRTVKVGTREERASASRRLVGMLARKGYGAGVAYSVVREAIAARGAEEDEFGEEPPED